MSVLIPQRLGAKLTPPTLFLEVLDSETGGTFHHRLLLNEKALTKEPRLVVDEIAMTAPDFTQTPALKAEVLRMVQSIRSHALSAKGLAPKASIVNTSNILHSANNKENTPHYGQQQQVGLKPAARETAAAVPSASTTPLAQRRPLGAAASISTATVSTAAASPYSYHYQEHYGGGVSSTQGGGGHASTAHAHNHTGGAMASSLDASPKAATGPIAAVPLSTPVRAAPESSSAHRLAVPVPVPAAASSIDPEAKALVVSIGDLQKVGPAALQAAKAKMDLVFDANRLKPGDPGYVYDRRIEFSEPKETSDWDD